MAPLDFSYGRTRRIKKRSDFGLLRSSGTKAGSTRHFTWIVRARTEAQEGAETRLGLVVSTRAGNAVVRNRIKRWSRELFRTQHAKLPKGLDLLLIYRAQEVPTTQAELAREWTRAIGFLAPFADFTKRTPTASPDGAS